MKKLSLLKVWVLLFIYFQTSNSFANENFCSSFYAKQNQEISLTEILFENTERGFAKSVKMVRNTKDGFIEIRLIGDQWGSSYNYSSEGFNNQGDPRFPIYLFGEELSKRMGIKAIKNLDGSKSLFFPNAKKIKLFLKVVNAKLIEKGLDPITYLPTKFGYANTKEMIVLSQRKNSNFKLHFPFEDNDENLTPHEIAYHLGQIVFPKDVMVRASAVTERTLQFISLLESKKSIFGNLVDRISEKLLKERALELDFGTGNTMVYVAYIIKQSKTKKLKDQTKEDFSPIFHDSLQYLSRPNYLPSFAVAERLNHILDLPGLRQKYESELSHDNSFGIFETYSENGYGSILRPRLKPLEKKFITQLIIEFIELYSKKDEEAGFRTQKPEHALTELVLGLSKRVDEITEAAKAVDLMKLFNSK